MGQAYVPERAASRETPPARWRVDPRRGAVHDARAVDVYFSLFLVSFLAATLLPAYSEVVFAGLLAAGHDPLWLWIWATAGNTLGSALNWAMGRYLLRYQGRRWFPFRGEALDRAQVWFQRYGVWTLLLAWAPIVGDGLTFVAGVMRVRFPVFVVLTGVGKGVRYAVLLGLMGWIGTPLAT
jgi:membrane protein YqaA with SNARE-associated domain